MSAPVDELRLVRDFFGDPPVVDDVAAARARRRLQVHVAPRPRRVARFLIVAATTTAITVAAVGSLPTTTGAARALEQLSAVASDLDLAAGVEPVVYERAEEQRFEVGGVLDVEGSYRFAVRSDREIWRSPTGTVDSREVVTTSTPVSPQDVRVWEAAGKPPRLAPGDIITGSERGVELISLAGLPSDPRDLLPAIEDRATFEQPDSDIELLRVVGELLARGDATPELRADLFRAAATIPGIELLGPTRDPLGREGLGLALGAGVRRVTLVVDPQTSVLLSVEERFVLEGDPVTEWIAYSAWGTVPEIGDRPDDAGIA
jgi:hypothetical protein